MKTSYKLLIPFVLSVAVLAALYLFQPAPAKNGFNRWRTYTAEKLKVLDLEYNSYYISGLSANRIYLGNTTAPKLLFSCGYDLNDTLSEIIPFTFGKKISWKLANMQIDSPAVYLSEYKTPSFVSASLPFKNEIYHSLEGLHFDLAQVLSPNSLIVNGYNPVFRQKALQKIGTNGTINQEQVYKHQLQHGSNFSIDGYMSYNKARSRIIFTYYYRNEFVCLDTNMKVMYTGKMIDTNTVAKITMAEIEKDGQMVRTMAKPALTVNNKGYSDGNWYYNHSALTADNEDNSLFGSYETIDVYQLDNGKYSHSIYLPGHKGENMTGFAVKGKVLIALYGQYIVTYRLK